MAEIEIVEGSFQLLKMTDEEYFSEKYKDYVSNSRLGLLNIEEGGSEEKFKEGFKSGYSDSFELGSAVHAMVLQPEFYEIADLRKPSAKLGIFAQEVLIARREGKKIQEAIDIASVKADYYSGKLTGNRLKSAIKGILAFYIKRYKIDQDSPLERIYLSEAMYAKYSSCMMGVMSNQDISAILRPKMIFGDAEVFNEYAILCELKVIDDDVTTIVKVKAKLDNFTINHDTEEITLNDLKTTGKPAAFFMGNKYKEVLENGEEVWRWSEGSFQKYHYYRQMGMYLWLLQCYIKQTFGYLYKYKANIVLVETIPNFKSKICKVNGNHIILGLEEFKTLIIKYAGIGKVL